MVVGSLPGPPSPLLVAPGGGFPETPFWGLHNTQGRGLHGSVGIYASGPPL